jgi:hypothetical protein
MIAHKGAPSWTNNNHRSAPSYSQAPIPPEGKAASSQNTRRHGLHTRAIVIPGVESEDDWRAFHDDVFAALAPEGPVESSLADRIAGLMWRIARIPRAERDLVAERQMHEDAETARIVRLNEGRAREYEQLKNKDFGIYNDVVEETLRPQDVWTLPPRVLPSDAQLNQVIRYESHLGRQLRESLHELEAMQARRNGDPTSLARVDVHVTRGE